MRKPILLIAFVISVAAISGCATVGPGMVDPRVYNSQAKKMVAQNDRVTTVNNAEMEEVARKNERAKARHEQSLKLIKEGGGTKLSTAQGVIGGVVCVFINDSKYYNKTVMITGTEGEFKGKTWVLLVPKGEHKEFSLETGTYCIQWTNEGYSQVYPRKGASTFEITSDPHFFYYRTGADYHGGFRLTD